MNILFFLKPKGEVAYVHDYCTLRQVLETMEYHRYSCIPMLNKDGKYVGTITEGDLLWFIKKQQNMDIKKAENIFITDFPKKNKLYNCFCRCGYGRSAAKSNESEFRSRN